MTTPAPLACSLTAVEMPVRLAEIEAIGRDALLESDRQHGRSLLRFRRTGRTRERLAAVVAAEARCCAFLDFDLQEHDDLLTLSIAGPSEANPILEELVAAFEGRGEFGL